MTKFEDFPFKACSENPARPLIYVGDGFSALVKDEQASGNPKVRKYRLLRCALKRATETKDGNNFGIFAVLVYTHAKISGVEPLDKISNDEPIVSYREAGPEKIR